MSVVVVGLDHKSAPLEILERVAINGDRLAYGLELLAKSDHIAEAVILSTCMRTEVYVDALRFHGAVDDIRSTLSSLADIDQEHLKPHLYEHFDDGAYVHLFMVAAGLESAVVGESEILGQVARSWESARRHGTCRSILGGFFRHAVEVGKRARHETAIGRGITSIGQASVVMAEQRLGGLADKSVLVIGAGDMGEGMAVALTCAKNVGRVFIVNRTAQRADALAERVQAESVAIEQLPAMLNEVDLILTSTGAALPVLTVSMIEKAMSIRGGRPLVIVDVAVPRDVEEGVSAIDGVSVLNVEDLRRFADVGIDQRKKETNLVEQIVSEEVDAYVADSNGRLVAPVVAALREHAEEIRLAEIERQRNRLSSLSDKEADAVHALTKSIISKLLHDPTVRLKGSAGTPEGERMAETLRLLFGV